MCTMIHESGVCVCVCGGGVMRLLVWVMRILCRCVHGVMCIRNSECTVDRST